MSTFTASPRDQRLNLIAEQYRNKGFQVTENPTEEQLPAFLKEFQPALLVRQGDQTTAVAVTERNVPAADQRIPEMARALQQHNNWNFELITTEHSDLPLDFSASLTEAEINQQLAQARHLLGEGLIEAALLIAWSAAEAVLRKIGYQEELFPRYQISRSLIKILTIEGVISRGDHNRLMEAAQARNAVAHGYRVPQDPQIVQTLIDTVAELLQLKPTSALIPA